MFALIQSLRDPTAAMIARPVLDENTDAVFPGAADRPGKIDCFERLRQERVGDHFGIERASLAMSVKIETNPAWLAGRAVMEGAPQAGASNKFGTMNGKAHWQRSHRPAGKTLQDALAFALLAADHIFAGAIDDQKMNRRRVEDGFFDLFPRGLDRVGRPLAAFNGMVSPIGSNVVEGASKTTGI